MWKDSVSKILLTISGILFLTLVPHLSNANDIYKWKDENGKIHFTDNPALIPRDRQAEVEIIEERKERRSEDQIKSNLPTPPRSDHLVNGAKEDSEIDKEEARREYWRSRALEIDNEEQRISKDISLTKNLISNKKREVDYLLTNGYFANRSILELRNLEDRLKQLEFSLSLIKPEREKLEEEARRAGVPPGYLRP
jgi:hypothetical protein